MDANGGLVAAQIETDSGFRVGAQETLFTIPQEYSVAAGTDFYDITSDDQRFLMARPYQGGDEEEVTSSLVLVQNFFEELKERVGG